MVWAAGPDGVERVGKNRFLYQFFESGVQTPAGESWYLQGKGHFFWVFRQVPGRDMEVLKVCGDRNVDAQFDLSLVQRRRQNVKFSQAVYTTALDDQATTLPLVLIYTDEQHYERLCFFHCALVPQKLLKDFQDTMAISRNEYGWVPPYEVNPDLYDAATRRYIPNKEDKRMRRAKVWTF